MDPDVRKGLVRGRGDLSGESQKGSGKAVLIGGAAAVLFALGMGSLLSWPWSDQATNIGFEERDQPRGPVTIEAEELHQAYQDDWDAASDRFGGREMVVSGEFVRIVPDGYGSLDMRLKTSDPEEQLGIDVAQLAIEDAKQLRPGQRVTVSCQQMGSGGDELWVQDCAIQPTGDVDLPSAETAPPAEEQEE